jgi:ribonuclease HI
VRAHPHRKVTVLTDCLHALWLIEGTDKDIRANRAARELAAAIAAERGPDVRLAWVKAHNGHPLNEAADTLAKQARLELHRNHDLAARDLLLAA